MNRPEDYLGWTEKVSIEFWPELRTQMHARGANIREVSEDYLRVVEELDRVRAELDERRKLDKVLLQSEREAMLTMIAAMAVKGYAYSPGSDAVADITSDVTKVGLTLDVKTVRKWVKEAVKLGHREGVRTSRHGLLGTSLGGQGKFR